MSPLRLLAKRLINLPKFNCKRFGVSLKDQLVFKRIIVNSSASFGIQKINFCTMADSENIPSKEELSKKLTPLQYHVTQEKGTERPFTGEYDKKFDEGTYSCIVCGQYLFSSNTKYDSGCGWPAFNDVLEKGRIKLLPDTSGGRIRTEVQCSRCSAHLGHVFDDGPKPTGKRYCINSASISFLPGQEKST